MKKKKWQREKNTFIEYKQQIQTYNMKMARFLSIAVTIVMGILFTLSTLNETTRKAASMYLSVCIIMVVFAAVSKRILSLKFTIFYMYILIAICYASVIYLSVYVSSDHRAGAILGALCLIPTLFIEKPWRIMVTTFVIVLIHSVLSYQLKGGALGLDDLINCAAFGFGGTIFGILVNDTRIKSFALEKLLDQERNMDYLTGVSNRRKMFLIFAAIEEGEVEKPTCALMMDIDNFKAFNDENGHKAGDLFLNLLGKELKQMEKEFKIQFFRYGGEEISALVWGVDELQQKNLAEEIRMRVEKIETQYGGRTVSIGFYNCIAFKEQNYELALNFADVALYEAKRSGKNRVIEYKENKKIDHSL